MPPLVRRYVRTSFVFLMAGLGLGGYLVVSQFLANVHPARIVITAHVHLLFVVNMWPRVRMPMPPRAG